MFKILVYHGIVKKLDNFDKYFQKNILVSDFKKQILALKKRNRILSLFEFEEKWQKKKLKSNEAMIFFDDCYQSVLNGVEILENFKIPAVFAISSDLVNKGYSWIDDIEIALTNSRKEAIKFNQSVFDISNKRKRFNAILFFKKYFQTISTHIIEKSLKELAQVCEVNPREINQEKFKMISWKKLRQINLVDFFKIVHHGHSHYPIPQFINRKKLSQDIRTNIEILSDRIGLKPYVFVYPFGQNKHYNKVIKEVLRSHGFKFGFTTENKAIDYGDPFNISRIMAM